MHGSEQSHGRSNPLESACARDRVEFYRDLLLKANEGVYCHHVNGQVNGWAAMDGAVGNGRYVKLGSTKFELLLQDGLATMQMTGRSEKAYRIFRRASAIEACNELPYLYGAPISPNPVETLLKAIDINPTSLKARLMIGDALAERGNIWEALRWFKDAAELFPDYELPYMRSAPLLERVGQTDQANLLSEKASFFLKGRHPACAPDAASQVALHL